MTSRTHPIIDLTGVPKERIQQVMRDITKQQIQEAQAATGVDLAGCTTLGEAVNKMAVDPAIKAMFARATKV